MRIAEVACPVPVHKTFHYEAPAGMAVEPGRRVRVPFGPRRLTGVVLSVFEGAAERPLKRIEAVLDGCAALDAELLDCARWLTRRYGAPIGECIKALLPAFIKNLDEAVDWSKPEAKGPAAVPFHLTSGQERAVFTLLERLRQRRFSAALLYGVPAAGKTEV